MRSAKHATLSDEACPIERQGFTLVELLVVIGIMTLLMAILLPLLGKVRQQTYLSATRARLANLSTAIEQYKATYAAYPGPIGDDGIITSANPKNLVTCTENCVLGLLGGWVKTSSIPAPDPGAPSDTLGGFSAAKLGSGPIFFNTAKPGQGSPIGELASLGIRSVVLKGTVGAWAKVGSGDTVIPEFMDAFPDPLPIIYLRACVGANGMATASNGIPAQYDLGQVSPYLPSGVITFPDATYPIMGSRNPQDSYVAHDAASANDPVHKDHFILIAAGAPVAHGLRKYGTVNDLRN